jgi:hypothetical protein
MPIPQRAHGKVADDGKRRRRDGERRQRFQQRESCPPVATAG